jgi:hypothetical protein
MVSGINVIRKNIAYRHLLAILGDAGRRSLREPRIENHHVTLSVGGHRGRLLQQARHVNQQARDGTWNGL